MKIAEKVVYKKNIYKIVKRVVVDDMQPWYDIQNGDVIIKNVKEEELKVVNNK